MSLRRFIRARSAALLTVGAMALAAGVVVVGAPTAAIANECTPAGANPMGVSVPLGSDSAYTIYTTGDAILSNSELEGTLAVGGTATFGDPRGNTNLQYPIFHGGVGGNSDYGLPLIDGADNRVLLNRFATSSTTPKIVQVQVQDGLPVGGAKIIDQTTPAGYVFGPSFDNPGTTYFPSTGNNQSPQLDSESQLWDGGAGEVTFDTALPQFDDYFPEDTGVALLSQAGFVTPTVVAGGTPDVALTPGAPNQISLADLNTGLAGANIFTMSGFSEQVPLIVTVSPTDVVGGLLTLPSYANAGENAPGNAGISYLLFDLSDIAGDVTIVTPDRPVRGSIYAPSAHVIFPPQAEGGKEFEGQLIASSFTALQGGLEMHTNLFLGVVPCGLVVETGGFSLQKALVGVAPSDFPDGTVFEVTASWSVDDVPTSEVFELPVDGGVVAGPSDLPVGTVVSFTEATAPEAVGFDFVGVAFSPATVTVGADTITAVTATNTYSPEESGGGGDGGGGDGGGGDGGSGGGSVLPATGADVAAATFTGAVLLLVGALVLAAAKLRRRQT